MPSTPHPVLPPQYEPVHLRHADSARAEAYRRAATGAGEGTLVWVDEQLAAPTRSGAPWDSPAGNLHCAVVLEPGTTTGAAGEIAYVAAVSAGAAVAGLLSPMTGLRYRWPNRLLLNDLQAGRVDLLAPAVGAGEALPWLVVGFEMNVAHHPRNPEPERYNSMRASGAPEATATGLLEDFTRHFLSWINRWAEDGFEPVRRAWVQRADGIGEPVGLRLADGAVTGVATGVEPDGALALALPGGGQRSVAVAHYLGLGVRSVEPAGGAAPGVYVETPSGGLTLVHEYLDEDYRMSDVHEVLGIGRMATDGRGDFLVLTAAEQRQLRVTCDAESFDHPEGLVEMCRQIAAAAAVDTARPLRFRSAD